MIPRTDFRIGVIYLNSAHPGVRYLAVGLEEYQGTNKVNLVVLNDKAPTFEVDDDNVRGCFYIDDGGSWNKFYEDPNQTLL